MVRHLIKMMSGDAVVGFLSIQLFAGRHLMAWQYGFIPLVVFASFLCEVYSPEKVIFKVKLIRSIVAAVISYAILIIFFVNSFSGAGTVSFTLFCFLVLQNTWQGIYQKSIDTLFFAKNVLVIGTGMKAEKVHHLIEASPGKFTLVGYIKTANDPVTVPQHSITGHIDDIAELVKENNVHTIVIALTERRGNLVIENLVTCKLMGVRIMDYPSFFETITGKIPVEDITPSWLIQSRGFLITPFIRVMKRIIDIVFASIVLGLTLPFFPLIALLIKLGTPGPVFYFQQRVGTYGKNFTIYKFRSMGVDAEKDNGASWAKEKDPRVTRFGEFMRKTRIDELPQLINVLKGDMSFIGPRPERPEFVGQISQITPYYMERHAVKPGITGWAQVMYPYGASLGDSVEKLRYDLYYINNLSFFLEFLILFETIKVVIGRRGAR